MKDGRGELLLREKLKDGWATGENRVRRAIHREGKARPKVPADWARLGSCQLDSKGNLEGHRQRVSITSTDTCSYLSGDPVLCP